MLKKFLLISVRDQKSLETAGLVDYCSTSFLLF